MPDENVEQAMTYETGAFLYVSFNAKSSLRLNVSVFLLPCFDPEGNTSVLIVRV